MAEKIVINAEVKSNIGEVSKDASNAAGEFKIMGVSLNGVKRGFASAAVTAKGMFGSIKAGLISTGIGAFVILIGSLVSYFTNTKKGADTLKRAMAGLGAVVDVLTDAFSELGGIILDTFQDPMPALKSFGEGLLKFLKDPTGATRDMFIKATLAAKGFKDELVEETAAMIALELRTQKLRDADNEFMVQKAATRQEIEKARLNAEDETKSAKERLDALKIALELEEKTTNRELELARERMEIQKEEMLLSENSAEDEQKLAQLKTALIETETASVKMRRRVITEVNALEREILAEEKERAKEKQDIIDDEFKAKIKANDEWNKKQIADAKMVADAKIKETKRVADVEKQIAKAVESFKKATIQKGFGAAAQVIYNTQQGIMAAMGATSIADKLLPYPLRLANAISTGVMGAAALSTIMSTSPTGGSNNPTPTTGGGGTPAPQMMSGAFDISGGVAPEPMKAFVVTDEMSNSQNQLANIRRRATI